MVLGSCNRNEIRQHWAVCITAVVLLPVIHNIMRELARHLEGRARQRAGRDGRNPVRRLKLEASCWSSHIVPTAVSFCVQSLYSIFRWYRFPSSLSEI